MKAWCDSENTIKTFDFYTNKIFLSPNPLPEIVVFDLKHGEFMQIYNKSSGT